MKPQIPFAQKSPYGWWVATYIERAVWDDERRPSLRAKCLAWENTIILKARDRDAAYKKAVRLGSKNSSKFGDEQTGRTGHWKFEGLSSLLPIYEELKDGAEIFWVEHSRETIGKIRSLVKEKRRLAAFSRRG